MPWISCKFARIVWPLQKNARNEYFCPKSLQRSIGAKRFITSITFIWKDVDENDANWFWRIPLGSICQISECCLSTNFCPIVACQFQTGNVRCQKIRRDSSNYSPEINGSLHRLTFFTVIKFDSQTFGSAAVVSHNWICTIVRGKQSMPRCLTVI